MTTSTDAAAAPLRSRTHTYSIEGKFSKRSYNKMYIVKDQNRGMYVGKRYKKRSLYRNETTILARIHHPNIIKLVHKDDARMFAVFEYVHGKTLLALMRQNRKHVFKREVLQLIDVLKHLHANKVIYCDLKPDNVIVCNDEIKLIDFDRSLNLEAWCGYGYSLDYSSAELQNSVPTFSSDVWALGVILYEMYTGGAPFEAYESREAMRAIRRGNIDYSLIHDRDLYDLLSRMLVVDHHKRLSLDEVRDHKWMKC